MRNGRYYAQLTLEDPHTGQKQMRRVPLEKATTAAQAGRDAAAKGDTAHARKCFTSLKQCGTALDSPDCLKIVQLVGQALKKVGDAELGKLP